MHTFFAHCSTWKIVCKISSLSLLSATAGCAVAVVLGPDTQVRVSWGGTDVRVILRAEMLGSALGYRGQGQLGRHRGLVSWQAWVSWGNRRQGQVGGTQVRVRLGGQIGQGQMGG